MMAAIPTGRPDIPMMPMPVYPNPGFMHAPDNPHINKLPVPAARGLHNTHISTTTAPPSEPVQLISSNQQNNKTPGASSDGTNETAVDPSRLKYWNHEEIVELIQLYKKYLPEFHKFGQRKMNVWQRVTEELVAKGYGNFSWAECSAKFRSLRDSYRRTTTGGRAHTWQYYPLMKEIMKMEKMILEQEPANKPPKGTITCENEIRAQNIAFTNNQQPCTSRNDDNGEADFGDSDLEDLNRKRTLSDSNGPAGKKGKESDQESEIVIGKNFNGETVKAKTKRPLGPLGPLSGLQALGKSLCLPQTQLVVADDGQVVQTTSAPTGLFVDENGRLGSSQVTPARQTVSMPQWFKMYEKRTRAENNRRLEELKEMHQESLELQRQSLEIQRQKNELLKNLTESLAEFKSLLQR
ncbi:hypothetical protein C0Q70_06640 [Pomacea canaliculata]|uniref:Myb/SANT-like DNA-binding domain-containing protein n=1 Tax=Pomacea canaliculata TaxID=400727 RepID=A0A2T7PCS9_POMCA|nr:uncharacterized protein LOC112562135 isoform X2 [Pomacea canaliculata]PVD31228.1 hypothetical protein C0Q70_06640 [Pomacea canaliculata]